MGGPSSSRPRGGRSAGSSDGGSRHDPVPIWSRQTLESPRLVAFDALVPELGAHDDRIDQAAESAAVGGQRLAHGVDRLVVRWDEAPPERVGQELPAEVLDELLTPLRIEVGAEPLDAGPLSAP